MVVPPWTRKEVIGDCTLYLGDMRQVLPSLNERAHLCVTDAPYRLTSGGKAKTIDGQRQGMGGKLGGDKYDNKGALMQLLPWSEMPTPIFAALKDNADAYVMANSSHVAEAQLAFVAAGFKHHELLTWRKGSATRQPFYMRDQEFTQYFWKGRARHINDGGSKTSFDCPAPRIEGHKTVKPTALMALYILNSSDAGQLVLDPFAGSGTTILAALAFGRRAIGVEIEPAYFDLTCERIHAAYADGFKEIRADWERWRCENRIKGLAYAA